MRIVGGVASLITERVRLAVLPAKSMAVTVMAVWATGKGISALNRPSVLTGTACPFAVTAGER